MLKQEYSNFSVAREKSIFFKLGHVTIFTILNTIDIDQHIFKCIGILPTYDSAGRQVQRATDSFQHFEKMCEVL